jgi:hypothetical protein
MGDERVSKYKFNTRWNKETLRCACLVSNPACDRFKTCEVLELTHDPYEGIKTCMKESSYKKVHGALRQVR